MEAGKIYWLFGDFKILNPDEPDYWHSVAKVKEGTWGVSAELIRFHAMPAEFGTGDLIGYSIELQPSRDNFYDGIAKDIDSGEKAAEVKCELFENSGKYFLKGTWIASDDLFTWILILRKRKNKQWQLFLRK